MKPFDVPQSDDLAKAPLSDPFGRFISYVRVSVTDRCDFRCRYCMPQHMRFLPRPEVLTLEELDRLCTAFVHLGVRRLRLTGGEPLVRRDVIDLVAALSRHLRSGALDELTLTTNGSRLAEAAADLARHGVRRINVSLDTLDEETFADVTRGGVLAKVLQGLEAAKAVGLRVKINTVALAGVNRHEIPKILAFAHGEGFDLSLIETMPMGEIDEDRTDQFLSLAEVKADLAALWTLDPTPHRTGGPAKYVRVRETGGLLGFITPLSDHFCAACNRVRVTCTGRLHACLGHEEGVDLRRALRDHPDNDAPLLAAIGSAIAAKPERHAFAISRGLAPSVRRHMSTTGG